MSGHAADNSVFLESCYEYATIIYHLDMLHASYKNVMLKLSNVNKRAVLRIMRKKNDNSFSWVHEIRKLSNLFLQLSPRRNRERII